MVVETDDRSGFCFGVQNAVEIAEKALAKGEKVFSLGSIVHNDMEMERLSSLGLVTITHEEFRKLRNCKVLIRAHGEPPETYQIAEQNGITIIEATCPIVKKLQARIRDTASARGKCIGQVVIFGKPGHAEVVGLLGQTDGKGILVSGPSDIDKIDFTKTICLYSQTTMSPKVYMKIARLIRERIAEKGSSNPDELLKVHKTICSQVSNREPHLKDFATRHDVILFVSGKESSNGKMLYSVCRSVNQRTHFISSVKEIKKEWFDKANTVGICGATSTPGWLIEKVRDAVAAL
ncbi:MAG: 4-hydroxy-3-methylbut-2-enyl diphosphate reductase [Bacteroidales bacterium]|jgi:4-hydroxy-3-methylbut-2-enyl diphosphate reductase|nr:4-hydroxy-3-methylbut-2-enyl diphosphate reductase [Bacteroidales bacterium]